MDSRMFFSSADRQHGFSLIELIVVIVILAVIGVVAVPRYADMTTKARITYIESLADAFSVTMNLVKAKALLTGKDGTPGKDTVIVDGKEIKITPRLYPVTTGPNRQGGDGIGKLFEGLFTGSDLRYCGNMKCRIKFSSDCYVKYKPGNNDADQNIEVNLADCSYEEEDVVEAPSLNPDTPPDRFLLGLGSWW